MKKIFTFFLTFMMASSLAFADDDKKGQFKIKLHELDPENVLFLEIDYGEGTGEVLIVTRPNAAPNHVARIKELIREEFYDGIIFHRVIPGFMAQGGDPLGNGAGGSGQKLDAEFNKFPHMRGTLSMARNPVDVNSADSQFFIMFNRRPDLDDEYTVWGRVIKGMRTVDKIPLGEPPANPAKIVRFRVAADMDDWSEIMVRHQ